MCIQGHWEVVEEVAGWIWLKVISQSCQHQDSEYGLAGVLIPYSLEAMLGTQQISCIELKVGIYTREERTYGQHLDLMCQKAKHISSYMLVLIEV